MGKWRPRALCYHRRIMKNNYRYLIFSVVFTVVGFGVWIAYRDQEQIFAALRQVGWLGFGYLCVFSLLNYGLRYWRWKLLLRHLGDKVSGFNSVVCYISGYALTTTPAKVGETIRCLYFKRHYEVHYGHSLAGILAERTTDAISSMFIAGFAFFGFQHLGWVGIAFTAFIAGVVTLVARPAWLMRIAEQFRVINITILHKLLDLLPIFLQRSASLFTPKPLAMSIVIALFAWSSEAYAFAWLAHQLGGQASTWMYMSIFALAMVAGALTFMPGGLGGAEVVLYMLMKVTGMGDAEAITATLLCRLATLWFAVALGLISVLWLERGHLPVTENEVSSGGS